MNSVYESWSRYYIPSEIISQYQLAPENYGDRLFIHPPLYVALCLACRSWLGLSLPAVSLLCHCVTCALVLALPYGLQRVFMRYNADHSLLTNVSLLAVLIYAFCPIVSFVSQKVWIDNAAVMCVTFSAVVHLMLSAYCMDTITGMRHGSGNEKIIRYITPSCFLLQFISGLVFGGIALNTKISSLALLPFILLVTLHSSLYSLIQESLTRRAIVNTVICLIAFACGMACGHGPWIWMYWVSQSEFYFMSTRLVKLLLLLLSKQLDGSYRMPGLPPRCSLTLIS